MPRANLNREKVYAAAAWLANKRGFAALSLKDIAAHLNVKPPSLFKHVRDLGEIKDALAVSGMSKLSAAIASAAEESASNRLEHILFAYRDFAKEFPGEYDAFQETHVKRSAKVYKAAEQMLAVFASALSERLTADEKVHALRFMRSAVHGFVMLEKHGGFGLAQNVDESFRIIVQQLVALYAV
ncbi:TetR/AcrR family transcriptional regulator [Turneriella parva]|uniref:Transcriptional regulator, TetR family n=1 Tax=Turneriella parva (strain ATCC BAA-1111 / DSM 21527 / NCTC 11395 / H) TaxID=869212 RepID=I4B325_TURPD|nr:TetR/AcrR family transcriptional regulator [Turneriella parva]AFM11682.1 transcriptional regulator, TetR family [Turneriella parva DSM 21527]